MIGYSQGQDRIMLTGYGTNEGMVTCQGWLTRLLTGRLLVAISSVIERSSRLVQNAPLEMKAALIQFEHQGSVQARQLPQSAVREGASAAPPASVRAISRPAELITQVRITTQLTSFELVLLGRRGPIFAFSASRMELHQLLDQLRRTAEKAGWNLQVDAAWMNESGRDIVLN